MVTLGGFAQLETPDFLTERLDKFGGPEAYNHYAVGWAHAMDTPYQWTKQVASHWGGTRNGTIVHWPQAVSRRKGKSARNSTMLSTLRRQSSKRLVCRNRSWCTV